jgi:hypothetical protein
MIEQKGNCLVLQLFWDWPEGGKLLAGVNYS